MISQGRPFVCPRDHRLDLRLVDVPRLDVRLPLLVRERLPLVSWASAAREKEA